MKTDLTVWGLALSMFMASLDTSIANAGLPAIAGAFGASFPAAQWVVLAYLLAITTVIVGAGRVGDLLGRRRVLLAGIGLFTGASALCGMAPSLGFLIGARAVQGLGAAVMMSLTVSFATEGRTMGVLGTMSALGTTLGPVLGDFATQNWPTLII
jgi:MFS family permease